MNEGLYKKRVPVISPDAAKVRGWFDRCKNIPTGRFDLCPGVTVLDPAHFIERNLYIIEHSDEIAYHTHIAFIHLMQVRKYIEQKAKSGQQDTPY